ncbi:peroxisome biogenesis factor 1, partial [Ostertagia ostertagi]
MLAWKPQCYLYVQVFGSLPFTHVFVNRRLAAMAKFDTNVEVILEQVNPTVCTSLDIAPLSQHDYEILDECSDEVEQVFLQQIRLVFPSMKFPLWVSPNVCVDFRV